MEEYPGMLKDGVLDFDLPFQGFHIVDGKAQTVKTGQCVRRVLAHDGEPVSGHVEVRETLEDRSLDVREPDLPVHVFRRIFVGQSGQDLRA